MGKEVVDSVVFWLLWAKGYAKPFPGHAKALFFRNTEVRVVLATILFFFQKKATALLLKYLPRRKLKSAIELELWANLWNIFENDFP
jgi:hypothetical protein